MAKYIHAAEQAIEFARTAPKDENGLLQIDYSCYDLPSLPPDAGDNYPIKLDFPDEPLSPAQIIVPTLNDMYELWDDFHDVIGARLHPGERYNTLSHEMEHDDIAKYLGANVSKYQLAIFGFMPKNTRTGQDRVAYLPTHLTPKLDSTRLKLALTKGYPAEPSEGDMAGVQRLGYKNIADLAQHAEQNSLPLPLSVRSFNRPSLLYKLTRFCKQFA